MRELGAPFVDCSQCGLVSLEVGFDEDRAGNIGLCHSCGATFEVVIAAGEMIDDGAGEEAD